MAIIMQIVTVPEHFELVDNGQYGHYLYRSGIPELVAWVQENENWLQNQYDRVSMAWDIIQRVGESLEVDVSDPWISFQCPVEITYSTDSLIYGEDHPEAGQPAVFTAHLRVSIVPGAISFSFPWHDMNSFAITIYEED